MVSSAVDMDTEEVIRALDRLRANHGDDPEYKRLRKDLPKDWPV